MWWMLLSLGCSEEAGQEAEPVSLGDMCGTDAYGDDTASPEAMSALDRTNCYRNLVGLEQAVLESRMSAAAQAHADYMSSNATLTHQETAGTSGYTGDWVWDRLEAAGYPLEYNRSWGEVVSYGYAPADSVDGWVDSVYHRIPFMSAEWIGMGFGQAGLYSSLAYVTPYPDSARSGSIYPVNGQIDVPTTFDSDIEWPDPAPDSGVVGYPISASVGSDTVGNDAYDPYNTVLVDWSLSGPDGDVDVITLDPAGDDYMFNMVAILPTEPLQAGAEYEAELTVSWAGGEQTFFSRFTTAASE